MNLDVHMAMQRARVKTVAARADAALARLGGETASRPSGSLSERLREGLSVEEMERDTKSMTNILRAMRRSGKGGAGSTIHLPSGRSFRVPGPNDEPAQLERAIGRTPKHLRPKRRKQG